MTLNEWGAHKSPQSTTDKLQENEPEKNGKSNCTHTHKHTQTHSSATTNPKQKCASSIAYARKHNPLKAIEKNNRPINYYCPRYQPHTALYRSIYSFRLDWWLCAFAVCVLLTFIFFHSIFARLYLCVRCRLGVQGHFCYFSYEFCMVVSVSSSSFFRGGKSIGTIYCMCIWMEKLQPVRFAHSYTWFLNWFNGLSDTTTLTATTITATKNDVDEMEFDEPRLIDANGIERRASKQVGVGEEKREREKERKEKSSN